MERYLGDLSLFIMLYIHLICVEMKNNATAFCSKIRNFKNMLLVTLSADPNILSSHWRRVTHLCDIELGDHSFMEWPAAYEATNHYLNQWFIACWALEQYTKPSIKGHVFENAVFKMASFLFRPQYFDERKQCGWLVYDGAVCVVSRKPIASSWYTCRKCKNI